MLNERILYFSFKKNVDELIEQKDNLNSDIEKFKLTKHCKSVDSMIDLKLLKEFQKSLTKNSLEIIIKKWKSVEKEKRTQKHLFDCQVDLFALLMNRKLGGQGW